MSNKTVTKSRWSNMMDRLQQRWGVGFWGMVAVLVTFSLTGMTVAVLREPVMSVLLPDRTPKWLPWVVYLIVVTPIYQVLLLAYGAIFGQFKFFWEKEKKLLRWLFRMRSGESTAK